MAEVGQAVAGQDELADEVDEADDDQWLLGWDPGRWLVHHQELAERGECAWLEALARFDGDEIWRDDGCLTCADWLMKRLKMARATAYEKLRVAHQVVARPVLAAALRSGDISYSAVRVCCRVAGTDPDVDEAFVAVARVGSVADVERAVRTWQLHADQERPPREAVSRPSYRRVPWTEGMVKHEIIGPELDSEVLAAAMERFFSDAVARVAPAHAGVSAGADGSEAGAGSETPVDSAPSVEPAESAGADSSVAGGAEQPLEDPTESAGADVSEPPEGRRPYSEVRYDAFMEMVRCAMAGGGDAHAVGGDRQLVHLIQRGDRMSFMDGSPVDPATRAEVLCDCSTVVHGVGPDGEPLYLGRRTRDWSTAQRRAAAVRDGGTCRFPGCERHRVDLHHQLPWDDGGPTDIDNAISLCPRHHHLLHHGFKVTGDPGGTLVFANPDHRGIGTTTPAQQRLLAA